MPSVTFFGGDMSAELRCDYRPDGKTTLLALAREHQLPIYWRCGHGTCGACAMRVTVLDGDIRPMRNKERNVLTREGRPARTEPGEANWRITCDYVLTGETLRAEW